MRTVLKGKRIKRIYSLIENTTNKDGKRIYNAKPVIGESKELVGYDEICSYMGEPRYNSDFNNILWCYNHNHQISISDKESVIVEKEIFRADLNEVHLITNKVLNEEVVDKEITAELLVNRTKEFNKQMIESDEKLLSYCKLHKLDVEETDVDELFNLVYPGDTYRIENGKLIINERTYFCRCSLDSAPIARF